MQDAGGLTSGARAMTAALVANQLVNGIQLGLILFLLAAGLTLVFGIMDVINLAHGAFYMLGAVASAVVTLKTGSWPLGLLAGIGALVVTGLLVEFGVIRRLYNRDHLDQVLATFGLILVADALIHMSVGTQAMSVPLPDLFEGQAALLGVEVPRYRLVIIAVGLGLAYGLALLINRTRAGMLIRAAASNPRMARALGVDTAQVFALVFGLGAVLAGIAGMLVAPITGASVGMGNQVIILAFVVIIIGGIGSVKGAFAAAMLVGVIDTLGRAFIADGLKLVLPGAIAGAAGPAIASILIYLTMVLVLLFKPAGLFPPATR
jgi:branched-chain amino acid transport system permease protein